MLLWQGAARRGNRSKRWRGEWNAVGPDLVKWFGGRNTRGVWCRKMRIKAGAVLG